MVIFLSISFVIFMILGLDVGFSMVLSSLLGILLKATRVVNLTLIPFSMVTGADNFTLVAIPLFILAGELMNKSGITQRLVDFSLAMVGHIRGSLSQVAIIINIIMAGISGSGVADASATGSILIPAMKSEGYDLEYSGAVIAAAATIGPIIPPSIPMIIFAVMANVSVAKLFLAGVIPGFMLGIGFMIICFIKARIRNYPKHPKADLKYAVKVTLRAIWALVMPIIIIGCIVFGLTTVTEAATIAVVYAAFVGFFVYRQLTVKSFIDALYEAGITSGVIMILLAAAGIFAWLLAQSQINVELAKFLLSITNKPWELLLLVNLLLLIIGCLLEPLPALIIFVPALIPLAHKVGIDLIFFGTMMVLNLMIGMLTPPVGFLLFTVGAIGKIPMGPLVREVAPFLFLCLGILLLVTFFRPLTLWIPSLLP